MNAPVLPGPLNDNPSLDRWVAFPAPGKVTDQHRPRRARPGRADRDGADRRRRARCGDGAHHHSFRRHRLTPNEGYTAGSQSIQFGGVAMRQACADVRALVSRSGGENSRLQGRASSPFATAASCATAPRPARITGRSPAPSTLPPRRPAPAQRKAVADLQHHRRTSSARLDLPAKIFGDAVFIHDMKLDGMVHARVVRQPNRGATIGAIDEAAIKRAAKGAGRLRAHRQFPRHHRQRRNRGRSRRRRRRSITSPGRTSSRRRRSSRRPHGCCNGRRSTASSARRNRPTRRAKSASRRPTRAAISRMPRSRRPAGWRNSATAI